VHSRSSAEYVACKEDVLDQYEQSYDAVCPHVCDYRWQGVLIGESKTSLPAKPGKRKLFYFLYFRHDCWLSTLP
jgi:hypothetical protein